MIGRFFLLALLGFIVVTTFLVTGCGEKKSSEPGEGPDQPSFTLTVETCSGVGGGPKAGTYYYH